MVVEPEETSDKQASESDVGTRGANSLPAQAMRVGGARIFSRLLLLAGVVGLAGLVAWVRNERIHGPTGAELALFSTFGCGCSAAAAFVVVGMTTGGPRAFAGLLWSILIRTLVPLALGVLWRLQYPDWPVRNLIEVHVSLFLVSLTVETILVVDIVCGSVRSASSLNVSSPGKGRVSR